MGGSFLIKTKPKMILSVLTLAIAFLLFLNAGTYKEYIKIRKQLVHQQREYNHLKHKCESLERNIREEANKNIILQSLITQKHS